jgi:hypothetical protein
VAVHPTLWSLLGLTFLDQPLRVRRMLDDRTPLRQCRCARRETTCRFFSRPQLLSTRAFNHPPTQSKEQNGQVGSRLLGQSSFLREALSPVPTERRRAHPVKTASICRFRTKGRRCNYRRLGQAQRNLKSASIAGRTVSTYSRACGSLPLANERSNSSRGSKTDY